METTRQEIDAIRYKLQKDGITTEQWELIEELINLEIELEAYCNQ